LLASYGLVRTWFFAHQPGDPRYAYSHVFSHRALFEKERYALSLLGCALVLKWFRLQSLDAFLDDALTYSKVRLSRSGLCNLHAAEFLPLCPRCRARRRCLFGIKIGGCAFTFCCFA
jgi:hypothetical protein